MLRLNHFKWSTMNELIIFLQDHKKVRALSRSKELKKIGCCNNVWNDNLQIYSDRLANHYSKDGQNRLLQIMSQMTITQLCPIMILNGLSLKLSTQTLYDSSRYWYTRILNLIDFYSILYHIYPLSGHNIRF